MALKSALFVVLLSLFITRDAHEQQQPAASAQEIMQTYNPIKVDYASRAIVDGWHMANACLLRPLTNPNAINKKNLPELYIIPGRDIFVFQGDSVIGLSDWSKKPGRIYVAEGFKNNPIAWGHEFAHILIEEANHVYMIFGRCQLFIGLSGPSE